MKTLGTVILCFTLQLVSYAQTDGQASVIVFYTTDAAGPAARPVVYYSNGQKIGEVAKGQLTRLVVQPGTYEFVLMQRAGVAQQISVSIGGGQELYLRVTRTAFFAGNASEAIASAQTVTPASVPQQTNSGAPTPEPVRQPAQMADASNGSPGVLRCAFSGTLSVHATGQPGSPIVAGLRCGDPVVVIDPRFNSFHVRTQDGKEGYIIGANLGQWLIESGTAARATASAIPSPQPSTTAKTPPVQGDPQTPVADLNRTGSTAPLPPVVDPAVPVTIAESRTIADLNAGATTPAPSPSADPVAPITTAESEAPADLNPVESTTTPSPSADPVTPVTAAESRATTNPVAIVPIFAPAADPVAPVVAAASRIPADLKPANVPTPSPVTDRVAPVTVSKPVATADLNPAASAPAPPPSADPVSPVAGPESRTAADSISPPDTAPAAAAFLSKVGALEANEISSPDPDKTSELSSKGKTNEPSPDRKNELPSEDNTIEVGGKTYKDYVIGPGDVLSIVVWGEPNLSTKVTVRSDGKIALALLDEVQAGGLTPIQLKDRITVALKKYLNDPNVYLIPLEIHSQYVYIVGSVGKPGVYPLDSSMRVTELLVRAGGFAEFAKPENIVIVRRSGNTNARLPFNYKRFLEGKAYQQDVVLQSGDMVIVP